MDVGIIGCCGHYRFALESAERFSTCRVSALASSGDGTDDAPLRALSSELGIPFYEDWQEMLSRERLDVVEVDSRFDQHARISAACLERGLNVFSEKPLATTMEDLDMLEKTWRSSGKALGGMFNYRFAPWFLAAQAAVQAGEIGKVRLIHGQKSYKLGTRADFYRRREECGGIIPWVAIHAIDWCLAFGGRCRRVSALQSAVENHGLGDLEMTAVIQMELEDQVFATVSADYLRPAGGARHDDDRLRITGTRGMLEAVDGQVYLENDRPRRALPLPEAGDVFGEFLRAIRAGEADLWARQALESTRVSLMARQAGDEGRTLSLE